MKKERRPKKEHITNYKQYTIKNIYIYIRKFIKKQLIDKVKWPGIGKKDLRLFNWYVHIKL